MNFETMNWWLILGSAYDRASLSYIREELGFDPLTPEEEKDLMDQIRSSHPDFDEARAARQLDFLMADEIAGMLLDPETVRERLSSMTEEQAELLLACAGTPLEIPRDREKDADFLTDSVYAIRYDGCLVTSADVKEAFLQADTESFREQRKQNSWILRCLNFLRYLYVAAPVDVLYRMFQRKPGAKADPEVFRCRLLAMIAADRDNWILKDDLIIDRTYVPGGAYRQVLDRQGEENFYIPEYREVEDLALHGYLSEDKYIGELRNFLIRHVPLSYPEADRLTCEAWNQMSKDVEFGQTVTWLVKNEAVFSEQSLVDDFLTCLQLANNNTRKLTRRGHTPSEIHGRQTLAEQVQSELIRAEQRKRKKDALERAAREDGRIYPNDPCPCGSGKKYKHCCGR